MALPLLLMLLPIAGCSSESEDPVGDRIAKEHEGDRPIASAAAMQQPAAPVEEQDVVYASVDGRQVTGFLARPEGAEQGLPAIIVIHEWWGLNDNIRAMARQLAGAGYAALAVDLYGGQVADTPEAARELAGAARDNPAPLEDNLRQAYAYLKEQAGAAKIGVIGWCFGGGWSLQTAIMLGDGIDAAVVYYGRLTSDPAELETLTAPVLGLFGAEDQGIPVESVREFESAMQALGKPVAVHVYEGAGHAFGNPSGTRYNAEAAEDAWAQTLAFFEQHLKG